MADTNNKKDKAQEPEEATATKKVEFELSDADRKSLENMKTGFERQVGKAGEEVDNLKGSVKNLKDELTTNVKDVRAVLDDFRVKAIRRDDKLEDMIKNSGVQDYVKCATHEFIDGGVGVEKSENDIEKMLINGDFSGILAGRVVQANVGMSMHPHYARNAEKSFTTTGNIPCEAPIFPQRDNLTCLRDWVTARQTTGRFSEYLECGPEQAVTPNCVDPGTEKPELDISGAFIQNPACKQAWQIPVTEEDLTDIAGLRAFIEGDLRRFLDLQEEINLVQGTTGTIGSDGLIARAEACDTTATDPLDRLAEMQSQVLTNGYRPNLYLLNPADWVSLVTTKNAEGDYIYGNPQDCDDPACLWGINYCLSTAVPVGTAVVGDFGRARINDFPILGEFGTVLQIGYSGDGRINNILTLIAERRSNIDIPCGDAFVTCTLATT